MSIAVVNSVYTPLGDAELALAERAALRREVEAWWDSMGWGNAPMPPWNNTAVLARQIATFRYEDALFASMVQKAGLRPFWLEYRGDKMSDKSSYKRSLLHPTFFKGRGRNGGMKLEKAKLVRDMTKYNGQILQTLPTDMTRQQEFPDCHSLLEFHHRQFYRCFPKGSFADNSIWVRGMGGASGYYAAYLSLFVAHGVLFEDYHGGESGHKLDLFTTGVFEPALEKVRQQFGVGPLIVPLPWWDELRLYPSGPNWREDGIIPSSYF